LNGIDCVVDTSWCAAGCLQLYTHIAATTQWHADGWHWSRSW